MKLTEKLQKYKGNLPVIILIILAVITILVVVAVKLTQPGEDIEKFNNDLATAETLYESKDYSEALKLYRDISEQFPTHVEAYDGMVQVLVDKNLLTTAEEIADSASERVEIKAVAPLYLTIGNAYYNLKNYTSAQDLYTKAYECDNQNKSVLLADAKVSIQLNDLDKAGDYLDISDDNSEEFYESVMLKTYLWLDNIDMADGQLQGLAAENLGTGRTNDLYTSFRSTIDKIKNENPDDLYKVTLLSREYINAGYPYLAIALLEPKKDQMGEYWDGLYFLGRAYFDVKDYDSALQVLDIALETSPQSPEVYLLEARCYIEKNDAFLVETKYEKAISYVSTAEKVSYLEEYYQYLYSVELYNKAITVLNQVEEVEGSAWLELQYADVYHVQKDYEKMKFHLDKLSSMTMADT